MEKESVDRMFCVTRTFAVRENGSRMGPEDVAESEQRFSVVEKTGAQVRRIMFHVWCFSLQDS